MTEIHLIGAPIQAGASQPGCLMGPDALRTAGIAQAMRDLGFSVADKGNLAPRDVVTPDHPNPALRHLGEVNGWLHALADAGEATAAAGAMPVFLGGDHALSLGSVAGLTRHAARLGRPLFVLWLDAHPDLHSLDTTTSGNLHGTPVGYFTGQPGFSAFPDVPDAVPPAQVCFMGLRSVDPAERSRIADLGFAAHDMRAIDEQGVGRLLAPFLDRVRAQNGLLHVSLDVDFLDPAIAPAVGTTVPGGATFREAHLIMEMLHDSALVTSLDLVELNPFLDERGRTASLMVDLTASLLGRTVLDRMTRSFA